jgi:hypothetical protein
MSMKRGTEARTWIEQLKRGCESEAFLVRVPETGLFVIECGHRRRVRSGLLGAALEELFGRARPVSIEELKGWIEGPPVEVLEAMAGPAFVIVGGLRLRVRGLPLPHLIAAEDLDQFADGAELDVAAANIARERFERALSGSWSERARAVLTREGLITGSATLARHAAGRLRQAFTRSSPHTNDQPRA